MNKAEQGKIILVLRVALTKVLRLLVCLLVIVRLI